MNRVFISIFGFDIYWYAILILIGILIGIFLACKEAKRISFGYSFMNDLSFYIIPISLIGARLYYVIFNYSIFRGDFLSIFKVWEGGLAIYGGIIAGIIFIIYYCKKNNKSILKTTDIIAPSLILGQAIGRWGNFINGEAYGRQVTLEFLQKLHLPNFIIDGMHINGMYYEPTFLYESLWCILGFIVLMIIRYKCKNIKIGTITSVYFIWYGIERFFVEKLRSDSLFIGDYRISVIVSVIIILVGIVILFINRNFSKYDNRKDEDYAK